MVAGARHVRHIRSNGLNALHKLITAHTTVVVKVIGKVAHMDDSRDVSLGNLLDKAGQGWRTAVLAHVTVDEQLRHPIITLPLRCEEVLIGVAEAAVGAVVVPLSGHQTG